MIIISLPALTFGGTRYLAPVRPAAATPHLKVADGAADQFYCVFSRKKVVVKKTNLNNPIILLSALGTANDRINGLEIGADDYLPKPFEPKELLLRIKNLLRKNKTNKTKIKFVKFGPFKFNLKKEILIKENSRIILTPSESKILQILAKNNNEPIYREDLSKILKIPLSSRALDVQITRLRHKIEKNKKFPIYLQTVRGRGYVLKID